MRFLILGLLAFPLAGAAAEPPAFKQRPLGAKAQCPTLLVHKADPPRAELKKLNELPPADAFHAVYRLDGNGCIDPVMVGYQFGRR
jgi:hypothetical protein